MKKTIVGILASVLMAFLPGGCLPAGVVEPTPSPSPSPTPSPPGNEDLRLIFVTGGSFPTGQNDDVVGNVPVNYLIGDSEVKYEVWAAVRDWATANGYVFDRPGRQGGINTTEPGPIGTDQHPATDMSWRGAVVWCNALTEWHNQENGTSYVCAYTYEDEVIRDATDTTACDNAVLGANNAANGFRLPTSLEWERAARWRNDAVNTVPGYSNPWFTKGDSAAGATANGGDAAATQAVAWYVDNAGPTTQPVKTKTPTSLGLFDMSGNVWEWCWDIGFGTMRIIRSGCFMNTGTEIVVGNYGMGVPDSGGSSTGMRIARWQIAGE